MTHNTKPLIAAALVLPLATIPAQAASKTADTNAKIEALEQQLDALKSQLSDLKKQADTQKAETQQQYAEVKNQYKEVEKKSKSAIKTTLKNGAPEFVSDDGRFSAKLSANLQADYAYYNQKSGAPATNGPDLNSGAIIRRAQIGLSGKVYGDWKYNFLYDFAGSGSLLYAYGEYDGIKDTEVRFGALLPSYGIEDQTGSTQLMFLERNTPTNITRGIAGSEGRMGIQALYHDDRFLGGLAWTMGKYTSSSTEYDQQQALVARAAYLFVDDDAVDAHLMGNVAVQQVFKVADSAADGTSTVTLKDVAELKVDSTSLINTSAMAAKHVTAWTVGGAGNYQNFYLQGEYNGISVDRSDVSNNDHFNAWYLQGSWILTGESKTYSKTKGSFSTPKPTHAFDPANGGWGAWELAARYSDTDLDSHIGDESAVYGGQQKIYTVGLNWYPNNTVRFDADYMHVNIDRTNASLADLGQDYDVLAVRAQVSF